MALSSGSRCSEIIYVYDLPYTERKSICNILDMNEQWERLGGEKMGFSVIELSEIKRAEKCGESPTDRLLQLWGRKNNTILNLYLLLYDIEHFQAMNILKPFISQEYHLDKMKEESSFVIPSQEERNKITTKRPPANLLIDMKSEANQTTTSKIHENYSGSNHNINKVLSRASVSLPDTANKKVPDHFLCSPTHDLVNAAMYVIPKETINAPPTKAIHESQNLFPCDKIVNTTNNNFFEDTGDGKKNSIKTSSTTKLPNDDSGYLINNLVHSSNNNNNMKSPVEESQRRQQSMISNISNLSECGVPMIPYNELEDASGNWSKHHFLGNGGFGSVYKGTWINVQVAIKRINPTTQNDSAQNITQTLDELKYLLKFRHDNILQVYGFSADEGKPLCLVYQFMPNGSLEYRLQCKKIEGFDEKAPKPLTWYERFFIAKGTAAALEFLHTVQDKPLIHGDVKSANILLDKNLEPKLGDFGLAREGPQSQYTSMQVSHVHGTRPYIPEEYLRSKKLSTKVDTYSYGIVLFEICTGCKAYHEKSKKYLKDQILEAKDHSNMKDSKGGPDNVNVFEILFDIGLESINKIPKKRPDMASTFQKLKSCAKAVSKDDLRCFADEFPQCSPSVSPISITTWQDTFASHSTSPSTFQSAALFLHPSRVPTPHRHQLNHLPVSVQPNSIPYGSFCGFSPLPNPPLSPVPHLIPGIRALTHGWMKGNGGSSIHPFSPSIHVPCGMDQVNVRNNNTVSKLNETSLENECFSSEEGIVIPIPDFSKIMQHSSHVNFETTEQCTSTNSLSETEESSLSQKSHRILSEESVHSSSNLLKSYSSKENKKSTQNIHSQSDTKLESSKPSSFGKKLLLD